MKDEYREVFFINDRELIPLPERFAIVTACNPLGPILEGDLNRKRDGAFRRTLVEDSIDFFRVTGGSRDMSHREPGYGCVVDLSTAAELGRAWEQDAAFWIAGDDLTLVSCLSAGSTVGLGSFRERVLR